MGYGVYRGEIFGDWGRFGYASGNQIHHFENAYVDKDHPAYINLTTEEKALVNECARFGCHCILCWCWW